MTYRIRISGLQNHCVYLLLLVHLPFFFFFVVVEVGGPSYLIFKSEILVVKIIIPFQSRDCHCRFNFHARTQRFLSDIRCDC